MTQMVAWEQNKSKALEVVTDVLRNGGLVALPSETVYGLAGRLDAKVISSIFDAKGRPQDNPLIVHAESIDVALSLILNADENLLKLANAFWPGPLTLVAKRHETVPSYVTCGLDTIAVRVPAHPCFNAVLAALGEPLVAPSANLSGRPSPTLASHVEEDLAGRIDIIVDAGHTFVGVESTVIDVTDTVPVILRPGTIDRVAIESVLGLSLSESRKNANRSPGTRYQHYCPKHTEIVLMKDLSKFKVLSETGGGVFAVAFESANPHWFHITRLNLFETFRRADASGVEKIYILWDEALESDEALSNRVLKAARLED